MSEHTPGQWRMIQVPERRELRIIGNTPGAEGAETVCIVPLPEDSKDVPWLSRRPPHRSNTLDIKSTEANARLIAASPEMLKALKSIAGNGDGTGRNLQLMVNTALDAIAKAEGHS